MNKVLMIDNSFFVPKSFTVCLFKSKIFVISIKNDFMQIIIPLSGKTRFNSTTNVVSYVSANTSNLFQTFFKSITTINLQIIKFKGKGYKLTRKHKLINFLFNFSHINYLVLRETIAKKITKNRICLINQKNKSLVKTSMGIFNTRPIDMYTYNGFRLKRQLVSKRKGKTISN